MTTDDERHAHKSIRKAERSTGRRLALPLLIVTIALITGCIRSSDTNAGNNEGAQSLAARVESTVNTLSKVKPKSDSDTSPRDIALTPAVPESKAKKRAPATRSTPTSATGIEPKQTKTTNPRPPINGTVPPPTSSITTNSPTPPPTKVAISHGSSTFDLDIGEGRRITVWYHAAGSDLANSPIVVAMHGASRDAEGARNAWRSSADAQGLIVVAPQFSESLFPDESYNLGGTLTDKRLTSRDQWSFPIIENLFDQVVAGVNGTQTDYVLYGHSAGAQFVERFALLWQPNRVSQFVAANAGWHTFLAEGIDYPYGIRGAGIRAEQLKSALASDLLVMVGQFDNDPNAEDLRQSSGALAQGASRLDRAINFFDHARARAETASYPLAWALKIVPGASHDNKPMVDAATQRLFH